MKIPKKVIIIASIPLSLIIIALIAYILLFHKNPKQTTLIIPASALTTHPTLAPKPKPTPLIYNFLNGVPMDEATYTSLSKNRPLAVMIPNDVSVRSEQYGINKADIVYEALTEGPVTRYMAIFWSHQEDFRIMPIRSIRVYFLQWLLEYNDIIVAHSGYAQTDNPKTNAYAILQDDHVKTLIWDWPFVYDQTCLNNPNIPGYDCARSSSQTLWNTADQKHGWTGATWGGMSTSQQWKFKDDAPVPQRGNIQNINIPFLYKLDYWTTNWVYNKNDNTYYKEDEYKKPLYDALDNSQINTKTLIVEQVPYTQTYDAKLRSIQEVEGSGKAYVFEDGNVIQATWKKANDQDRTRFYDQNGNEIAFNRGRIWISVIPSTQPVTYN